MFTSFMELEYMNDDRKIKVHTLKCGTMQVRPGDAYIEDRGILKKRIELPVNAFLVEHPVHGNILIDTGWSEDAETLLPQHLREFYRPCIRKEETAKEQLHNMGIEPEDIELILLTHLDVDHTCALKDFAGKTKRIIVAEQEYFYSCRNVYKRRQVWDTWMPYADEIEKVHYRASVLGPAGRGFDVFGDDSVLCVFCPGHTDGMFSVVVNRSPSNRFIVHGDGKYGGDFSVFASDAAFSQRNISDCVVPGYGFDRGQQRKTLEFLKEIQTDPKCRRVFFSHCEEKKEQFQF